MENHSFSKERHKGVDWPSWEHGQSQLLPGNGSDHVAGPILSTLVEKQCFLMAWKPGSTLSTMASQHIQLCRLDTAQYEPHLSSFSHTVDIIDMYIHCDSFLQGVVTFLVLTKSVFYNNFLKNRSKASWGRTLFPNSHKFALGASSVKLALIASPPPSWTLMKPRFQCDFVWRFHSSNTWY